MPNQESNAVGNVLRGAPAVAGVQYPIIGDAETDFISGVLALAQASNLPNRSFQLALEYLARRFQELADKEAKLQQWIGQGLGQGQPYGTAAQPPPFVATPLPYVSQSPQPHSLDNFWRDVKHSLDTQLCNSNPPSASLPKPSP